MRVHHLDCGPVRPMFTRLKSTLLCTLLQAGDELILVDTGLGRTDLTNPTSRIRFFTALMRCEKTLDRTAVQRVSALGYDASAVGHVILTHLHFDHSGGIPDFPHAQVHVLGPEYEAATRPRGTHRLFYEPAHWAHRPHWRVQGEAEPKAWFGFDAIRLDEIASAEVLMIPLAGHTPGHAGVAIRTDDGWVFHCGDALPFGGLESGAPDWISALALGPHGGRIRQLAREHGDEVEIVSSHLPTSDSRLAQDGSTQATRDAEP